MPTIGKFVIGNVATLQSASNINFDPTGFKYVHASSSNVALAFKNLDDSIESLSDSSVTTSSDNNFTGKVTASNGLLVRGLTDTDGHANTLIAADGEVVTISGDFTASSLYVTNQSNFNGITVAAASTFSSILTASSGITVAGTSAFSGDLTTSGKLTASNGINISGGELVVNKSVLSADGNAGATADSVMLFDSSDSDLAKTITIAQLNALIGGGGDEGDVYAALTGSNTFSAANTFTGKLTASNGISISGGELVMNKSRLTADSNAGATADSVMLFDSSDSDLAKTITIAQLSSLVGGGGDEGDVYAALTSSNSFTGANTFSHLTASKGIQIASEESIKANADGGGMLEIEAAGVVFTGAITAMSSLQTGGAFFSGGAITASNGLMVMSSDDAGSSTVMIADTGSFAIATEGAINITSGNEAAAAFPITLGSATTVDGAFNVAGKITSSGGFQVMSDDASKDYFVVDSNGNTRIGNTNGVEPTGSDINSSLLISSEHKAYIHLNADIDNSDENGTSYVKFSQDNGAVNAIMGTIGGGNTKDPEGNDYTGTFDNNLLIGTLNSFGMQLGTNSTARINIENDGEIKFISTAADTTSDSANMTINASTGKLERSTSDRRGKHTITSLTSSLADICQLEPRHFYNLSDVSGSTRLSGLVADEVQSLFPELVPERGLSEDILRSVAYDRVVVYLINALKEVKQRLENLEDGD